MQWIVPYAHSYLPVCLLHRKNVTAPLELGRVTRHLGWSQFSLQGDRLYQLPSAQVPTLEMVDQLVASIAVKQMLS